MIGQRISHYRVLEKIGGGGMGVIYRAEDTRLKRDVALKFLPPDLTRDPEARERLIREAQAASALDHPSICTVYEINQTEDEQMYIAMAYYPGENLREKIERGPLPYEQVLEIAIEIARGLEKTHGKGVIHRDIKPANIIVTEDGFIKIVDFGLAILSGQTHLTADGVVFVGTVNYMSPEQARDDEVDHRTDIWSLGMVMIEMVTGKYPFKGTNPQSVIYSILHDVPEWTRDKASDIPMGFQRIINKCLEKESRDRYPSMSTLLEDLQRLQQGAEPVSRANAGEEVVKKPSVAVLPFENLSNDRDQEYFCDGITDEIIHALGHVDGIRVLARASAFAFKNLIPDIKRIGRQLGVDQVLLGTVRSAGDRLRIFVELINVSDGYTIWSERYDRRGEDVFSIQDDISQSIVENLKGRLLGEEKDLLGTHTTQNIRAYHFYLQGYYFLNKRSSMALMKGREYLQQAIDLDPSYTPAYVGLADAFILFAGYELMLPTEAYSKAREALRIALQQDDSQAWAHAMQAIVLWEDSRDSSGAEWEFRKAIELAPGMALLHHVYAEFLSALGHLEQALVEVNLALELDPLSLITHVLKGFIYYLMGRYDQAIKHYHSVIEMDPAFVTVHCELGMTLIQSGKYPEGVKSLEKALALSDSSVMYMSRLAYGLGRSGNRTQARAWLKKIRKISRKDYVSPFSYAVVHLGLEDYDRAISFLERAYDEKNYHMLLLKVDPLFDPVRSDPRIRSLMSRMGFSDSQKDH